MSHTLTHRFMLTAALTVALAMPSAAIGQQDLRSPDARAAANQGTSAVAGPYRDLRSPDARDVATLVERATTVAARTYRDLRSPDARDAARPTLPQATPAVVVEPSDDGFDWGDAAIGAAVLIVLLLLLGGGARLVSHRHVGPHDHAPVH